MGILCKSDNKVLVGKVKGNVFDCLIKNGKELLGVKKGGGECEVDEKGEVVLLGTIALGMRFAARLLELGSPSECLQGNRKVVFGLHEEFLKLEKEKGSLGLEVLLPEVNDEAPQLIPINGEGNGGGNSREVNEGMEVELTNERNKESKKGSKENKKKKKDKIGGSNFDGANENVSESLNAKGGDGVNVAEFNETMISTLQLQFEKIAAESGLDGDGASALDSPTAVQVKGKSAKRRKRSKSLGIADANGQDDAEEEAVPNTGDKSVKRVRFAMKNNIVWKPQNPMPPQSVGIPPSSTPRGSTLKKGLFPGPIRDTSLEVKKLKKKKKRSPLKKAKKVKSISPSAKGAKKKKVNPMSA